MIAGILHRKHAATAIGMALLFGFGLAQNAVRSLSSGDSAFVPPPAQYIGMTVDPKIINRLLGLRIVAADLIWIDTLIKSDTIREKESFTPIYRAFKTITTLDPDNMYAYYVAGLYLSVIKDDIKGATAILREGAKRLESTPSVWADVWNVPFVLGYNLIFEEQEIEEGSKWIMAAAKYENAPVHVKALGERVKTEYGRLEVASRVLIDMYKRVSKPEEKLKIEKKMAQIAARQEIVDLNEKFERFLRSTEAYALPKQKAFMLFIKTIGHPRKDVLGRPIGLTPLGKIDVVD